MNIYRRRFNTLVKMGWKSLCSAWRSLSERPVPKSQIAGIAVEILATPGVLGLDKLKARMKGSVVLAEVHLKIDSSQRVAKGHQIASQAKLNVTARYPSVLLITHLDPVAPTQDLEVKNVA